MRTFPKEAFDSQSRPLCRHYVLVLVEALAVEVEEDAGVENVRRLHWALGVLDDGQHDVFELWSTPTTKSPDWRESFAKLKDRGVDKIDLIAGRRSLIPQAELSAIYPHAKSLSAPGVLTPELLTASSRHRRAPGWRSCLPSVDARNRGMDGVLKVQDRVQGHASRSISRHGQFSDEVSATAFALNALKRAEQRFVAASASLASLVWYRSSARRFDGGLRDEAVGA